MKKPVIVISSHVARGSVGNRAAVFAMEVLGHPVWAVPTVILPFHPGHGTGTRIIPPAEQFESFLGDLLNSRWISEVGAVLTGYMANPEQALATADFIKKLKELSPKVIHACDPVMGDRPKAGTGDGSLYISQETATAIRDDLVTISDIITPNRFELSWLTGLKVDDHKDAITAANYYQQKQVLITSMPGFMRGNIGNLLVQNDTAIFAEHRELQNPPNGPGDLTAALFLSHICDGIETTKALQRTTASVFEIVAGAAKRGADELMLESDAGSITRPMTMVQIRNLPNGQSEKPAQSSRKKIIHKPTSL